MSLKLYHGSNETLDELDASDPGYEGSLGYGLYLTTQPEFAEKFGKYVHEVASPVPDELVAYVEPNSYDCGGSLTIYTPGSVPFSFDILDLNDGETHRYSVLGDCDEEVKAALRSAQLPNYRVSQELVDDIAAEEPAIVRAVKKLAPDLVSAMANDDADVDVIEKLLDGYEHELDDDEAQTVSDILESIGDEADEFAGRKVEEMLGDEIDLDDMTVQIRSHGYSAFFIEGYAPGDEYVIFDDAFLPVPVINVEKLR